MRFWKVGFSLLFALPFAREAAAADPVADFYRGKQLNFIISTGAGGGYELYARPLSRHIGRYIPGEPTIVLQHMEGGGGIRAMNYLYNAAARDGTVIGMVHNTVAFVPLYGVEEAKFDATKVNWLGSMNDEGAVCIGWHTAAAQSFDDLQVKPFIAGSTGPGSDMEIYALALNRLAGTKIRVINGYKSANDIYLAMEKGEVEGRCGTAVSGLKAIHPEWFDKHLVRFLVQTALERGSDPVLKDTPLILDRAKSADERAAWRFIFAPQKMARPVLAPPGVPADRLAALREAMRKTMSDPAFLAEMETSHSDIHYLPAEVVQQHVAEIYATPAAVRQMAISATRSGS
jgi:tripartite-type tricarboxylate transporter receptor subunit TctC